MSQSSDHNQFRKINVKARCLKYIKTDRLKTFKNIIGIKSSVEGFW